MACLIFHIAPCNAVWAGVLGRALAVKAVFQPRGNLHHLVAGGNAQIPVRVVFPPRSFASVSGVYVARIGPLPGSSCAIAIATLSFDVMLIQTPPFCAF